MKACSRSQAKLRDVDRKTYYVTVIVPGIAASEVAPIHPVMEERV